MLGAASPLILILPLLIFASITAGTKKPTDTVKGYTGEAADWSAVKPAAGEVNLQVSPKSETTLTWKVGNVRITCILERTMLGKISAILRPLDGQMTPEAIAPYRQWLHPHFLGNQ
jgi:hypothetical protein